MTIETLSLLLIRASLFALVVSLGMTSTWRDATWLLRSPGLLRLPGGEDAQPVDVGVRAGEPVRPRPDHAGIDHVVRHNRPPYRRQTWEGW